MAIGPVFATASKSAPEPTVGLEAALALAAVAKAERPSVTRTAIGGIDETSVPLLRRIFDLVAVIGALFPLDDGTPVLEGVAERARQLVGAARGIEQGVEQGVGR